MSSTLGDLSGGLTFIPVAAILPSLKLLLISTVFSSFLIPTSLVLFVFSTPTLRRRPTFVLNVCAITLGLTQGMIYIYITITQLVAMPPSPTVISIITVLCILAPICVQAVLFVRVLAVYPPRRLPLFVAAGMYGPLLAIKVARVANAFCLIYAVQRNGGDAPRTIASQSAAVWSSPFAKSELFLQLADDVYVSTLFLLKIRSGVKNEHRAIVTQGSYASRLRTLFWIALSNFVFPAVFDVAQLVLVFRDASYMDGSYVVTANSYVSIIGVLFATIWASGSDRTGEMASAQSNACSCTSSSSYGMPLALGHVPRLQKPLPPDPLESLAVPPELKVSSGSTTDVNTLSADGHSTDGHGLSLTRHRVSQ